MHLCSTGTSRAVPRPADLGVARARLEIQVLEISHAQILQCGMSVVIAETHYIGQNEK